MALCSGSLYSSGRILRLNTNFQSLKIFHINLEFMKSASPMLFKKEVLCLGMAQGSTESSCLSFLCGFIRCLIPDLEWTNHSHSILCFSVKCQRSINYCQLCVAFCDMDSCLLRIALRPQNHLIEPVGKSSWWEWLSIISTIVGFEMYLDLMDFITWVIQLLNFSFVFREETSGQKLSVLILIKQNGNYSLSIQLRCLVNLCFSSQDLVARKVMKYYSDKIVLVRQCMHILNTPCNNLLYGILQWETGCDSASVTVS